MAAEPFVEPKFLLSERGGRLPVHDGKQYRITNSILETENLGFNGEAWNVETGKIIKYLRCRKSTCTATAKCIYDPETDAYSDYSIIGEDAHSCPSTVRHVAVEHYKNMMISKVRTRETPEPEDAYNWAKNKVCSQFPDPPGGVPTVVILKGYNSHKATLNRVRAEQYPNFPVIIESLPNLQIPEFLRHTLRPNQAQQANFLLLQHSFLHPASPGYPQRVETIFVFGSEEKFEKLCAGQEVFGDGTFKVCPKPFAQLYILHTLIGGGGRVRPLLYCLLTRKTELIYRTLFEKLQQKSDNLGLVINWGVFHCDFEAALMNAVLEIFPEATIAACLFHFCSAIWKKLQALGLATHYMDDTLPVNELCRCISSLPFLKLTDIVNVYTQLRTSYEAIVLPVPVPDLTTFFTYFEDTWLNGSPLLRPDKWCVFDLTSHRTNNNVEGYHAELGRRMGNRKSLWSFLEELQREENRIHFDIQLEEHGIHGTTRRAAYRQLEARRAELRLDYINHLSTPLQYVQRVRHTLPTF